MTTMPSSSHRHGSFFLYQLCTDSLYLEHGLNCVHYHREVSSHDEIKAWKWRYETKRRMKSQKDNQGEGGKKEGAKATGRYVCMHVLYMHVLGNVKLPSSYSESLLE